MYVCMYFTAFASISSMSLQIEPLLFAVDRFRKKTYRTLEENLKPGGYPVSYRKPRFASEEYELMQLKVKKFL